MSQVPHERGHVLRTVHCLKRFSKRFTTSQCTNLFAFRLFQLSHISDARWKIRTVYRKKGYSTHPSAWNFGEFITVVWRSRWRGESKTFSPNVRKPSVERQRTLSCRNFTTRRSYACQSAVPFSFLPSLIPYRRHIEGYEDLHLTLTNCYLRASTIG